MSKNDTHGAQHKNSHWLSTKIENQVGQTRFSLGLREQKGLL